MSRNTSLALMLVVTLICCLLSQTKGFRQFQCKMIENEAAKVTCLQEIEKEKK